MTLSQLHDGFKKLNLSSQINFSQQDFDEFTRGGYEPLILWQFSVVLSSMRLIKENVIFNSHMPIELWSTYFHVMLYLDVFNVDLAKNAWNLVIQKYIGAFTNVFAWQGAYWYSRRNGHCRVWGGSARAGWIKVQIADLFLVMQKTCKYVHSERLASFYTETENLAWTFGSYPNSSRTKWHKLCEWVTTCSRLQHSSSWRLFAWAWSGYKLCMGCFEIPIDSNVCYIRF